MTRPRSLSRAAIWWTLGVKSLLFAFGAAAYQAASDSALPTLRSRLEIWNRWDALHYPNLAQNGYADSGDPYLIAFFPLYPWLIRLVAFVIGDHLISAFVVTSAASVAASVAFVRLARHDFGPATTFRALWFFLVFPTTYFLHIGYTESLFLALVMWAFVAAREDRWLLAGIAGALAALTRINGLLLLPALAFEACARYREDRVWRWQWALLGLVLVGFGGYLLLNNHVSGDAFAFLSAQRKNWSRAAAWPWDGIGATWRSIRWRRPADAQMVAVQELVFIAIGLAGVVMSWFRLRKSHAMWMTANWLLFTSQTFVYAVPRYTFTLFPLFLLGGVFSRNRSVFAALSAWCLLFLGLFASQFVQGRWAF